MKIPILLYHSISTQAAPSYRPWALPPEEFEAHVAYLRSRWRMRNLKNKLPKI